EGMPQPVQFCVLRHTGRSAGPLEPLSEADPMPGRLPVREEDARARLLEAFDKDEQLQDHRVDRHAARLLRLLARLVPTEEKLAGVEIDIGPLEVPHLPGPAAREPQEDEDLAEAGGEAGADAPPAVGGADLAAARIPAPGTPALRPDGDVFEDRGELGVG